MTEARDYYTRKVAGKLAAARQEVEYLVLLLAPDGVPEEIRKLRDEIAQAQETATDCHTSAPSRLNQV